MKSLEIINIVQRSVGIPMQDICKRSSKQELVDARKLMSHFLRKYTKETFETIGNRFSLDGTTIQFYVKNLTGLLMYDQRLQRIYNSIQRQIIQEEEDGERYYLNIPFLNQEIFISLMKKNIIWGNSKQTYNNLNNLYLNNFINK